MTRTVGRAGASLAAALLLIVLAAAPAFACGGLIGPNGAVNLLQTTTLAGYHDGEEHYVTAFQFAGGGGAFGSLTPLPGVPSKVEKGGDWTLQRLIRETDPALPRPCRAASAAAAATRPRSSCRSASTRSTSRSSRAVPARSGRGPPQHGFRLPPDAPEVLDFYAARSPIFLAAVFDADAAAARGQAIGDGTPVHITIPTDNPWVPLRILALGKTGQERVDADVYLLTDRTPGPAAGPDRRQRPVARPQRAGDGLAARRPPLGSRDGLGADEGLADQGPHRRGRAAARVRPGHRRHRAPGRPRASRPGWTSRWPRRRIDGGNAGRVALGLAFSIVGIGGILLLVRRQPPVRAA